MLEFQKAYCIKMLEKIEKRPISVFFRDTPADPRYIEESLDRPTKPMDLRTVRRNITGGAYKTMNDWGSDIRLIWCNAQSCYPPDTPMHLMAFELSNWFEKKWASYPRTEAEHWANKVKKLRSKIRQLHEGMPVLADLIPQAAPKG
jgi:hypothetical protein